MTRTWKPETSSSNKKPAAATTGMRLIVPLQGVLQGRGGLLLGSLIPCALFYFLQLYLKRHRPSRLDHEPPSPSLSSSNLAKLHRSSSCSSLSGRGSINRVQVSSRADPVAKPNESSYYIELDRARRRTLELSDEASDQRLHSLQWNGK
ncbi:hypothetical protein ACLB2K_003906 [Fragaria x ananassa]